MEDVGNFSNNTPPRTTFTISVIIPMYNAEKFVAECLDSLLIQTFQDFEVIVVDDCSTDNSLNIVNDYKPKFEGRLSVAQTGKNLGIEAIPRNIGLELSKGEYVYFMDADDFLLNSALETLYSAAKQYNVEVVYSGSYYRMSNPNDAYLYKDGFGKKLLKEGLEDKPDLVVDNPDKILRTLLTEEREGNFSTVWTKLCRREFLLKNNIDFPKVRIAADFVWVINVYCHVKRFLRISTPFYFYRRYNTQSVTQMRRKPGEQISSWLSVLVAFMKSLRQLESKNEVLHKNPAYCLAAAKRHFEWSLSRIREDTAQLSDQEIYEILHREFSGQEEFFDSMVPFFVSCICADRKIHKDNVKEIRETIDHFTARIDVKLMTTTGDLQILSVSDDRASVAKPVWLQKGGIGYQIESYAGNLKFIAKANVDGKIQLSLRGLDIRDPKNKSKRIPYWIDYTKLAVNGQEVFATVTPAWFGKTYLHHIDAKAGEEIKIQTEWIPHMDNINKNFSTEHKIAQSKSELVPNISDNPTIISVIVPMYNAEKYVAECLDSLLNQTFPYFEVIVVDDCSTDNSVKIVESYAEKFGGRLTLASMEKNSGSGAMPRNKGIMLSRGEYIQFLDSDDMITKTALEELYKLAKEYDADVVYCERPYMSTGDGEEFIKNIHIGTLKHRMQPPPYVNKPTLEPEDLFKRVKSILDYRFWFTPWNKFVKRSLIIGNEIFFPPTIISEDDIWTYGVVFYAKKFLRVPNLVHVYRIRDDSMVGLKRSPQQTINFWMNPILLGVKSLDNLMSKLEFFKKNPQERYAILEYFYKDRLNNGFRDADPLSAAEVYDTIKQEFVDLLGDYDVLIATLFANLFKTRKVLNHNMQFSRYFTARIDISLVPKAAEGDFQILTVSDDLIFMREQNWLPKGSIGYVLESYVGNLEFIVKATVDGRVNLQLLGIDVREPEDDSKFIPYWIDYTKLIVNGEVILDKLTPAWHNKRYTYDMDAKAGEEIKVQIEWLPHHVDVSNKVATPTDKKTLAVATPTVKTPLKDKIATPIMLVADNTVEQIVNRFKNYFTARLDVKLLTTTGNFQIGSMSDYKATILKPDWFQENGIGYQIESYAGILEFVAKATVDGRVVLNLLGLDVRTPEDNSKFIPYWIDYTKLIVNGKVIFDKIIPAWHNKRYVYDMDAKAGEEIKIRVEWLPYMSDVIDRVVTPTAKTPVVATSTAKTPIIYKGTTPTVLVTDEISEQTIDRFKDYFTARIDVKLLTTAGDFQILDVSDSKAETKKPAWLQKGGTCYMIQSYTGNLEFVAKTTVDGKIQLGLKGIFVRDPKDESKRLPYWINYTKLTVNGQEVFDTVTPAWFGKAYLHNIDAKAGEEIKVQVEWLPHHIDVSNKVVTPAPEPSATDKAAIPAPESSATDKAAIPAPKSSATDKAAIPAPKSSATDKVTTPAPKSSATDKVTTPAPKPPSTTDKTSEQIIDKFKDYFTARVDIKLLTTAGDFQILDMSDDKAKTKKPKWLQKNGSGYQIESYVGNLEFAAKATVDGKIQLSLRGLDIRDPKDNSKRIPYWIDYTKLTVNSKMILDKLTPAWHDKPYRYTINAKAGEEIKIQVEWGPHKSDT